MDTAIINKHTELAKLLISHIKNPDSLKKALAMPDLGDELRHIALERLATIEQSANLEGGAVASVAPPPIAKQEEHKMKDVKTLWAEMSGRNFSDINKILSPETGQSAENLGAIAAKEIDKIDKTFLPEILLFGMNLKQLGVSLADEVIKSAITTMAVINVKRPASNQELQKGFAEKIEEILSIDNAAVLLHDAAASLENHYRVGEYNSTVLHKAAHNGHPEIIKLLFNAGWRDVDPVDGRNKTPLYFSVVSEHLEATQELFSHDPDIIDKGHSAVATAMHNLSLWKELFIGYAQKHVPPTLFSLKELLGEISTAIHIGHVPYTELYDFYDKLHCDVTNLENLLEN